MAIVLKASRSAGPHARRATERRATIREVCLIGRDQRPGGSEDWRSGQKITWMGRGYQVVAAAPVQTGSEEGPPYRKSARRQYVHLTSFDEG